MLRLGCAVLALAALGAQASDGGGLDAGVVSAPEAMVTPLRAQVPELELPTSELDSKGEDLNLGWTLVRTALVLGIVVSLIYLTLNIGLRKLLGIKPPTSRGLVTLLERVPLDQKRSLFLIRAGSEVLLLGGSDASLQLITKLDAADVERAQQQTPAAALTLSPLLQKLLGKPRQQPAAPDASPDDSRKNS